jgi:O-antigen/teichoic acid export membrane protein
LQSKTPSTKPAADGTHERFARKTISSIGWTLGFQILTQGSQFLAAVILARLLPPEDFGLIAMVAVFGGFANLFSDVGFGPALIQRQDVEERHYSSVFYFNVLIGFILMASFAMLSSAVARFYSEPRLVSLMIIIGSCFSVTSFGLVQRAILTREMNFRTLGFIDFAAVALSGILAIALALSGLGVWSLAYQSLSQAVLQVIGLWWASGWRPRMLFQRAAIRELFKFSSNLTAFTAINYWYRNGDNLLVGKFFGSTALGVYSRAYNLMLMPLTQITYVVSKVMFPALSKLQDDKPRVKSIFLRSTAMMALVTFPLMSGLFVVADNFILAFYGPHWAGVVPILRVFCILGMFQSIATGGWIFQSQGRTDWMFWWGTVNAVLSIAAMFVGVWLGSPMAVAACLVVIGILLTPPGFIIPGKLIGMSLQDVIRNTWGVLACSAIMAGAVWGLGVLLPSDWSHWAFLGLQVVFGVVVYALLIHCARLAPYLELRSIAKRHVLSRRASAEPLPAQPAP